MACRVTSCKYMEYFALDCDNKRVVRMLYPTGYGTFRAYEITLYGNGTVVLREVIVRERTDALRDELPGYEEYRYEAKSNDWFTKQFDKVFSDPWWNNIQELWHLGHRLCPVSITQQ